MYNQYRNMCNAQGARALLKSPVMPNPNLAVADDDYKADVPVLIFTQQHQPAQRPVTVNPYTLPYEKTAVKGAGDSLSEADFVTNNFDIGAPFGSV